MSSDILPPIETPKSILKTAKSNTTISDQYLTTENEPVEVSLWISDNLNWLKNLCEQILVIKFLFFEEEKCLLTRLAVINWNGCSRNYVSWWNFHPRLANLGSSNFMELELSGRTPVGSIDKSRWVWRNLLLFIKTGKTSYK